MTALIIAADAGLLHCVQVGSRVERNHVAVHVAQASQPWAPHNGKLTPRCGSRHDGHTRTGAALFVTAWARVFAEPPAWRDISSLGDATQRMTAT